MVVGTAAGELVSGGDVHLLEEGIEAFSGLGEDGPPLSSFSEPDPVLLMVWRGNKIEAYTEKSLEMHLHRRPTTDPIEEIAQIIFKDKILRAKY